jgi:hypothetical protein
MPARPTGRRLHTPAFDELIRIKGKTCASIAGDLRMSEGHLSDMRAGRRLVSPPVAVLLADHLGLAQPDAFLWPAAVERGAA